MVISARDFCLSKEFLRGITKSCFILEHNMCMSYTNKIRFCNWNFCSCQPRLPLCIARSRVSWYGSRHPGIDLDILPMRIGCPLLRDLHALCVERSPPATPRAHTAPGRHMCPRTLLQRVRGRHASGCQGRHRFHATRFVRDFLSTGARGTASNCRQLAMLACTIESRKHSVHYISRIFLRN